MANGEVLYVTHDAVTLAGQNYNTGDRLDPNTLPKELADLARNGQLYGVQLGQGDTNFVSSRNAPPPITMGFNTLGQPIQVHLYGANDQDTHKGATTPPTEPLHHVVDLAQQPQTKAVVQSNPTQPPTFDPQTPTGIEPTAPSIVQQQIADRTAGESDGEDDGARTAEVQSTAANEFLAGNATDVIASLKDVEDAGSLDNLREAEVAGKNRSTVTAAIDARKTELQGGV